MRNYLASNNGIKLCLLKQPFWISLVSFFFFSCAIKNLHRIYFNTTYPIYALLYTMFVWDISVADGAALMPYEWNLLSISGPACGFVTQTVLFYIPHYFCFYFSLCIFQYSYLWTAFIFLWHYIFYYLFYDWLFWCIIYNYKINKLKTI